MEAVIHLIDSKGEFLIAFIQKQPRKLLERVSDAIQLKHDSGALWARSEQAYVD